MKNAFLKLLFKFKNLQSIPCQHSPFSQKSQNQCTLVLVGGSVAPVLHCNNEVIMTIWPIYILVHKSSSRISNEIKN